MTAWEQSVSPAVLTAPQSCWAPGVKAPSEAQQPSARGSGSCGCTWHQMQPRNMQSKTCRASPSIGERPLIKCESRERHDLACGLQVSSICQQQKCTLSMLCQKHKSVTSNYSHVYMPSKRVSRTCTCARSAHCSPGAAALHARAPRPPATPATSPHSAVRCPCSPSQQGIR